jgi:hypothetical protein
MPLEVVLCALTHFYQSQSVFYLEMLYLFRIMPDFIVFPAFVSCRDLRVLVQDVRA